MKRRSRLRFILEGMEGVAMLSAATVTWPISKRWLQNWGASPAELAQRRQGDELLSPNLESLTRAIDIDAPANAVWQWVAQLGLDRAGFYSYELLERIAGIPVTNLESIEPAMQSLTVEDEIRLHPKAPGIPVEDWKPDGTSASGSKTGDTLRRSSSDLGPCTSSRSPTTPAGSWCEAVSRRPADARWQVA